MSDIKHSKTAQNKATKAGYGAVTALTYAIVLHVRHDHGRGWGNHQNCQIRHGAYQHPSLRLPLGRR